MDSREKRDSDDTGNSPDTSHLGTKVVTGKKSSKRPLVLLLVLVVVVALGVGAYFYKTSVLDKDTDKEAAVKTSPSPSAAPKQLSPEEQMTAQLTNGVDSELKELKKDDGANDAIKNSTQAAASVGKDLHEDELKD